MHPGDSDSAHTPPQIPRQTWDNGRDRIKSRVGRLQGTVPSVARASRAVLISLPIPDLIKENVAWYEQPARGVTPPERCDACGAMIASDVCLFRASLSPWESIVFETCLHYLQTTDRQTVNMKWRLIMKKAF